MTIKNTSEMVASYVENLIVGICQFNVKGEQIIPVYMNEGLYRMLGYTHQEMDMLLLHLERSIIPEDMPVVWQGIRDIQKDDGAVEFAYRTVTLSGNLRWLQIRGNLYSRMGDEVSIICMVTDITEKKAMEQERLEQAERLNLIVQVEQEILLDYNAKTDVMVIRRVEKNGMEKEEIFPGYLQNFDKEPYTEEDGEKILQLYQNLLKKPDKGVLECRSRMFTRKRKWYRLVVSSIPDTSGYVTRVVGRMLDIHDQKLKELELTRRAEKDALSGLYNKGATTELIDGVLTSSEGSDKVHALMIVDMDDFKSVNDTWGHAAGDKLIQMVSARMMDTFRGTDIIGRIGGDEFVVFMKDIHSSDNADKLAGKLIREFQKPYEITEGGIKVTCSMGISLFPNHGTEYQELYEKADKAMYKIKGGGKNSYQIYAEAEP